MDMPHLPPLDLPAAELPVAKILPELCEVLAGHSAAILIAPPGAGKTTLVPSALLAADWLGEGKVLMLEPRRLAARAAATRIAAMRGETLGDLIGFRTRLESAVSAATRVEIITEGLLTRRLLSDPGLAGVNCVIFDEIHERSLEADLALALTLDLQRSLRPELRILAMSATPDAARLAALLNARIVESAGRAFPVAIQHSARDIVDPRALPDAMARAITGTLAAHSGDILVFLPGVGEIRRVQAALAGVDALVLPLYGDLPLAEQDLALRQAERRRVVLATSIAETSLTVPGVRIVIDGGYRRSPSFDAGCALTRLVTRRISRAAADQRAGRAGREAPGLAIRLWSEALHRGLPEFDRPEILDAELSGLALSVAAWGERAEELPFPDPPPAGALAQAQALLRDLGALDDQSRVSDFGRSMARLGATPRLAAMMLAAATPGEQALSADLAALLEERDPLRDAASVDIRIRLDALAGRGDADRGAITRIRQVAAQYRARLGLRRDAQASGDLAGLIAIGFPDRIAARRGEPGSFRLAGGGGAKLDLADPLSKAKLLAVAALGGKGAPKINLAAALDPEGLPETLRRRLAATREVAIEPASGAIVVRERLRLGALVLTDKTEKPSPAEAETAILKAIIAKPEQLDWRDAARQLQARVALMRRLEPGNWPDISDSTLRLSLEEWLAPHLAGLSNLAEARALDLTAILRGVLGWENSRRLDQELPPALDLPGIHVAIDYTAPVPVATARAQLFYGLDETPRLAGGRLSLQISLLSPAQRSIAVTADLPGFWRNGWLDARRDMRGRYPKHDWPEKPWEKPWEKP